MSTTVRRAGFGLLVLLAALTASLVTRAAGGSAAPAATSAETITHVNVLVHRTNGHSTHYADVRSVRSYRNGHELKLTQQNGDVATVHDVASYTTTYRQTTSSPTPTPTSTSTVSPSSSPSSTASGLPPVTNR
jgi:hypothetical protein